MMFIVCHYAVRRVFKIVQLFQCATPIYPRLFLFRLERFSFGRVRVDDSPFKFGTQKKKKKRRKL